MISDKTNSVGAKGGEAMSDSRLDIERDKYLEWKQEHMRGEKE